MQQVDRQTIRRKYIKQKLQGGFEVDFIARAANELLIERMRNESERFRTGDRALLLYEREMRNLVLLADMSPDFDLVPVDMIEHPPGRLREMLSPGRYSALVSNLVFDWVDPTQFISLLDYLLKPDGVFWFSCYGAMTVERSRSVLSEIDDYPHFSQFYDLRDIGDALLGSGFKEVVLESIVLNLQYTSAEVLFNDVERVLGLNLHPDRRVALTPARVLAEFKQQVELAVNAEGVYSDQVEILVAFGRKPSLPGIGGTIPVRQS